MTKRRGRLLPTVIALFPRELAWQATTRSRPMSQRHIESVCLPNQRDEPSSADQTSTVKSA